MARQYSTTLRNDWLQCMRIPLGPQPAAHVLRCCAGQLRCLANGYQLIEMTLPSDWQGAPSSGTAAKSGTLSGTVAADGTATTIEF